ncbi:MAG: hypothetical protein JWO04_3425 [Gammaproteobacteria bacterium]|nr:hypothetical protein [Gammaproteobacteria bacterium]
MRKGWIVLSSAAGARHFEAPVRARGEIFESKRRLRRHKVPATLSLKRQRRMDLCHHSSAFADCSRDALCRAGADVANREYSRSAGLQSQRPATASDRPTAEFFPCSKKSLLVRRRTVLKPRRIRFGANE